MRGLITAAVARLKAALQAASGAATIGFIQDAVGAVMRTLQDLLRERVSVLDFMTEAQRADVRGAGALDVTAAVQAAITAAAGKRLNFPAGAYKITSTLTVAGSRTALHFKAGCNINFTSATTPGFAVTGSAVSMIGVRGARLNSPAVYDTVTEPPSWGVIYVTGGTFEARGLTLINVPKTGIACYETQDATIANCYIYGNINALVSSVHFGIYFDPGALYSNQNLTVRGCHIYSCVEGVFIGDYAAAGTAMGINITGNTFDGCMDHGVYCAGGRGQVIANNTFVGCTVPIAINGDHASITGNTLYTTSTGTAYYAVTGISVRGAQHCIVANNTIKGDAGIGQAVISLATTPSTSTTITGNIVANNIIDCAVGASYAIQIGNGLTVANSNNKVTGNTIRCPGIDSASGVGLITLGGGTGDNNEISHNRITLINATYGIDINSQRYCRITDNVITLEYSAGAAKSLRMVSPYGSSDTTYKDNLFICTSTYGANIALSGIVEDGGCARGVAVGNRMYFDPALLTATTTFSLTNALQISDNCVSSDVMHGISGIGIGSSSVTVNNKNVRPNGVMIWPITQAAGQIMASKGYYVSTVDGVSFTVGTGDGTTVGVPFDFGWKII